MADRGFISANSASITTGTNVINVTGSVNFRYVASGTAIFLEGHLLEGVKGTAPDPSGNSKITLKENWTGATITNKKLMAFNTIEGLRDAIQRAREFTNKFEVSEKTIRDAAAVITQTSADYAAALVTLNTQITNVQNATTAANTATGKANTAASKADTATGKANTATAAANTAKTNADTATGKANTAAAKADTATGKANTATTQANTARDGANTAKTAANTATTQANAARDAANAAKTAADTATGKANTATTQANAARDGANTAKASADTATGKANTATTQANTARDAANTAAGKANTAATKADTAVAQIDTKIAGKVSKSGDVMTGLLGTTYNHAAPLQLNRKNQVGIQFVHSATQSKYLGVAQDGTMRFGTSADHSHNHKIYHAGANNIGKGSTNYAAGNHNHSGVYALIAGAVAQPFHAKSLTLQSGGSDFASIDTTISGTSTHLDFNLGDDVSGKDRFRFRFKPTGGTEFSVIEMYNNSSSNAAGIVKVAGQLHASEDIYEKGSLLSSRYLQLDKGKGATVAARYLRTGGSAVGTMIRLPFRTNAQRMVSFTVRVYQNYQTADVQFSGYLYSSPNNWYAPKAIMIAGSNSIAVKMGRDAEGYAYVWLTGANYRGVAVLDVVGGYTNADWNSGWVISETNTAPNTALSKTIHPPYSPDTNAMTSSVSDASDSKIATSYAAKKAYDKGVEAYSLAGTKLTQSTADGIYLGKTATAAKATKLATARSITLAGMATGSTTFDGASNRTITVNIKGINTTDNTARYGTTGIQYAQFNTAGGAGTDGAKFANPDSDYWHHIVLNHGNSKGYYTDIATCFHKDSIKFKRVANGSHTGWYELYHTGKKPTAADVGALAVGGKAADANKLDGIDSTGFLKTSGQHYNIHDGWLREQGDNAHVKLYGASRQMVFRTDGTTQYSTNGAYPFCWNYGGDGSSKRLMFLNTSGDIWFKKKANWLGALLDAKAASSHTHSQITNTHGGSSWINQKTATDVAVMIKGMSNSSYRAWIQAKQSTNTFTVGCLGNSYFGFFGYINTTTANRTDYSAFLGTNGQWSVSGAVKAGGHIYAGNATTDNGSSTSGNVYAASYYGSGNVSGTGQAVHCPKGIFSQGNNWLYGEIITNSNAINAGTGGITCGTLVSSKRITATGSGNDYHKGAFEARGNGSANTVFPTYGFHQAGKFACSIQARSGTDIRFYAQGASAYASITALNISGNHLGNIGSRLSIDSVGKVVSNNTGYRRAGMYGIYDSNKTCHIWSMGTAYQIPQNGSNFGNLYGFAYKHTNNTTGGTMGGGHMAVWCENGSPRVSLGTNIWASGNITAYSDRRVKTNLKVIDNALERISQVSGYTYDRTDGLDAQGNVITQAGVIAQEMVKILPEVVSGAGTDDDHYSVAYGNISALLIQGIKEEKAKREEVEDKLASLEERMAKLEKLLGV